MNIFHNNYISLSYNPTLLFIFVFFFSFSTINNVYNFYLIMKYLEIYSEISIIMTAIMNQNRLILCILLFYVYCFCLEYTYKNTILWSLTKLNFVIFSWPEGHVNIPCDLFMLSDSSQRIIIFNRFFLLFIFEYY